MIAYEKQLRYDVTVAALPHTVVVIWVTITSAPVRFLSGLGQIDAYHH